MKYQGTAAAAAVPLVILSESNINIGEVIYIWTNLAQSLFLSFSSTWRNPWHLEVSSCQICLNVKFCYHYYLKLEIESSHTGWKSRRRVHWGITNFFGGIGSLGLLNLLNYWVFFHNLFEYYFLNSILPENGFTFPIHNVLYEPSRVLKIVKNK
jgi:hypothetical protein